MSTSPYPFEDLLTAEAQATIRARYVSNLGADGLPTASWAPSSVGGWESLRLDMVSGALASLASARVAALVSGRLLEIATDDPLTGYFLTYLGLRFYKLVKRQATTTIQNIALTAAPTASSNTFADGDLWVKSPTTGNRYRLTLPTGQTVTLGPGDTVNAPFYAENPGSAYDDVAGTVTQMVTAKAGISCINVRPTAFRPTRATGMSTGQISGTFTTDPLYSAVRIRIDVPGDIGVGYFSWSTNSGLTWTNGGVLPASFSVPGGGSLAFANGITPSFQQGAIFTLRVADCFLQRGGDAETDDAFRSRCRNRYPALSLVPTQGSVELWSQAASVEVVRVSSDADPNIPGGILVTVASQTGPATPIAQEAVEDFIRAKLGFAGIPAPATPTVPGSTSPAESVQISSAPVYPVAAGATVTVPASLMAGAKAGADQAWDAYLASIPIGNGTAVIEFERFRTILGDLGAVDVQAIFINNQTTDIVVLPGFVTAPAPGWTLLNGINWVVGGVPTIAQPAATPPAIGAPFTANPQSIADLLPSIALDDVRAFLLAYLSVPQNPVTDWESGAAMRTYWELEAFVIQDLVGGSLPQLAANGYPGSSSGASLTKLAAWYGVARATPSQATQTVNVACDALHGPYAAAQVSALKGLSTDGVVYSVTAGAATLGTGSQITVTMTADSPGGARGLVSALALGLPGVAVVSAAIATFGSDGDSDTTVQAAMDARFPDLSAVPTQDRTVTWALAAAPSPLITRASRLDADPAVPGGVLLSLAVASGAVAGSTVTAVQAALDALSPITDNNTAQNSVPHTITPSGTVTIKTALATAAMAAADAEWSAYLTGAQIGTKVYLEALTTAVGDAIKKDPNSDFTGFALAGAGADGNVALAATEVPVSAGTLTSLLTWVLT